MYKNTTSILRKSLLFFCLLIVILFAPIDTQAEDRSIKITSPNGGEVMKEDDTYTITWESSSNIDTVAIGWSTGPGSLNWIAFSTPNTKSYSWKVNVGNTTNTQFLIDITGYETGKGSVNDKSDGYFTVYQKEEYPPTPTRTTYLSPTNSQTLTSSLPKPPSQETLDRLKNLGQANELLYGSIPRTNITPQLNLTINSISIWTLFNFEGSTTTDISSLKDLTKVENFTLDTKSVFTFHFTDTLNLKDYQTLKALDAIDDYWVIESWSVWIKKKWWTTYKWEKPVAIELKNKELTHYSPKIIYSTVTTDEIKPPITPIPSPVIKIDKKTDKQVIEVSGPVKFTIEPKVTLNGQDTLKISTVPYLLKGYSSHQDLKYYIKYNTSEKKQVLPTSFDKKTGAFAITTDVLKEGVTHVQLFVSQKDEEPKLVAEKTIEYQKPFFQKFGKYLVGALVAFGLISLGFSSHHILPKVKHKKN